MPLILFTNPAYAENVEIQMDWLLEGQLDEQIITESEAQIISNLENADNETKSDIIYDKFVTNNEYSIGEYEISIDSEEGQVLNKAIIEQQELKRDSFMHKIQYHDKFSDGYVEIVEALLEPVGEQMYLINGGSYDYYPNSNLEYFVLERGYDLENLEDIPNYIFSPAALDKARDMIAENLRNGKTITDLREISPNYMRLDENALQEKMRNTITEQTTQIFNEIVSGKKLQPDGTLSEIEIMISKPQGIDMFDNFKLKQSQFENTKHVQDTLQDPFQRINSLENFEELSILLLLPVFTGLAIFGYMMKKKLSRKPLEPLLQVSEPQIDYRTQTKDMLEYSLSLYNNNQSKEAHEKLSQAIRFYYSKKLGITSEITNYELILNLKKARISEYDKIRKWIILCGSVEYAKYKSKNNDFTDAISKFSKIIS